jgi:hypothetical protein
MDKRCSECGCELSGAEELEVRMCQSCYDREMQRIIDERRHPDDHGGRLYQRA